MTQSGKSATEHLWSPTYDIYGLGTKILLYELGSKLRVLAFPVHGRLIAVSCISACDEMIATMLTGLPDTLSSRSVSSDSYCHYGIHR